MRAARTWARSTASSARRRPVRSCGSRLGPGSTPDGVAGPRTRRALGRLGRPTLGSRTLRFGAVGADVAALQFALAWQGSPSGRLRRPLRAAAACGREAVPVGTRPAGGRDRRAGDARSAAAAGVAARRTRSPGRPSGPCRLRVRPARAAVPRGSRHRRQPRLDGLGRRAREGRLRRLGSGAATGSSSSSRTAAASARSTRISRASPSRSALASQRPLVGLMGATGHATDRTCTSRCASRLAVDPRPLLGAEGLATAVCARSAARIGRPRSATAMTRRPRSPGGRT